MRKSTTGCFSRKFPDDSGNDADQHGDRKEADEAGGQPILALALIENDLHAAETQADEADADVVDAKAFFNAGSLHVRRIADQQ